MQYLTFEEYQSLGGVLDLTAFTRNIGRACSVIDNATHRRIEKMKEMPNAAKLLCRDLIEHFANSVNVSSRSQSAGGVSESESFVIHSIEERASEVDDMLKDYLLATTDDNGVPLLYRGLMS